MTNNTRNTTIIQSFIIIIILLFSGCFAYFLLCHQTIDETELGLKKDNISGRVEKRVYRTGRHETWLFLQDFIRFPTTLQIIEFVSTSSSGEDQQVSTDNGPLNSRTSDGLQVIIEVSFTYQLQSWGLQLYYLYKNYTLNLFHNPI